METTNKTRLMAETLFLSVIFVALIFINPVYSAEHEDSVYYTCPMESHSDVAMATAGKCPKCGMELISKKTDGMKFICPMKEDSEVISDHPGKCPKCGMWLVPQKAH